MVKIALAFSVFLTLVHFSSQQGEFLHSKKHATIPEVDKYVSSVMERYGIPGVALAVIQEDEVIHKNYYGYANLEHLVPVKEESIFRVYSLTKLSVATGVFQLIEQNKVRLEDSVSTYVPSLPPSWGGIQIKHLLSHSSGLPDMAPIPEFQDLSEAEAIEKVYSQPIKFQPNTRYDYNQTNFWLLKEIIEQVENTPLEQFIIRNQFSAAVDTAFFSADSRDIVTHRVTAYFPFAKGYMTIEHPYLQGDYAYGMNGLNTSLDAFIEWSNNLHNDQLVRKETKEYMWQLYTYSQSNKSFTYGWDKRMVGNRESFGFSGSLVTAYRIFPDEEMSIIFLGNGLESFFDIETIVNRIAALVDA